MTESTQVATREHRPPSAPKEVTAITDVVERYTDEIAKLAPRGVHPAHYLASLRLYMASHSEVRKCTPMSVAQSILRVAQTGLELGVTCDILPFKGVGQFSPRYNGIIELALGAGVRTINADVVRAGDYFEWEKGTHFKLRHRHDAERGAPITHAYAIAETKPGSFVFEVMARHEIDEVRLKFSKQWKNGNLDDIPWYAKKTVVRRLSPYLPKNPRLAAALAFAASDEGDPTPDDVPNAEFEVIGTTNTPDNGEEHTPDPDDRFAEEFHQVGELTPDNATRSIGRAQETQ